MAGEAAQKRLFANVTVISASKLLFDQMKKMYSFQKLSDVVVIHNGQGLTASSRDEQGKYNVYAAGGLVGKHIIALSLNPFVVIGRKGSAGKPTYAPDGGWVIDTAYYAEPINPELLDCKFLYYALTTLDFNDDIISTAIPGINRTAIYKHIIPLPPIDVQRACVTFLDAAETKFINGIPSLPPQFEEQRQLVGRIEDLAGKIVRVQNLKQEIDGDLSRMLLTAYASIIKNAKYCPMKEVAPLIRRPVTVIVDKEYHELGIRSFGKGTFHKPAISGAALGTKRIFYIERGDLTFNIVFAWEGAVAIAKQEDKGRVGSHRFLTCVAKENVTLGSFLYFHFLTTQGLEQLGEASPGGAGRNRTLGIKALEQIQVPVPAYQKQMWFHNLQRQVTEVKRLQMITEKELKALMPSALDKIFKQEL